MKSKHTIVLLSAFLTLAVAALIAGGVFMLRQQQHHDPASAHKAVTAEQAKPDSNSYKYINLDKVIVMLRGKAGEPASHYLAMDLVIKTREEQERAVKDHLPMLRSVAVRSLSSYSLDKAGLMSIDQFTADINKAFSESYKREQREKPFTEAMISKLIIE